MSDGVKGPNDPVYTPSPLPADDPASSQLINPVPRIPKAPGKPSGLPLGNRTVQQTTRARPQVNKKAREKLELVNQSLNLVTQLEYLMTRQQFMAHKDALLEAIANPDALPEDFTVVYIDENGREVTVIPPDPQLQNHREQKTRLRNALQARVCELGELLNDDDAEEIDDVIRAISEQLKECGEQLMARGAEPVLIPDTPQRVCLDPGFLASVPPSTPLPPEDTFALDEKPKTKPPKKTRFDESQFSEQWINFYSSPDERIPGQPYTLENIRQLSDEELETEHDYIQLLFPNTHISNYNPGAPRLTNDLAETIHNSPALMDEVLKSVDQMLGFWGLERAGDDVTINPQKAARHRKWDGAFDHNHQRITRMLDFLMTCGKFRLAMNIEQALQNHRLTKQQEENVFWANAVGRQPGVPGTPAAEPTPPPQPAPADKVHHYTIYADAFPYDQSQDLDRIDFYHQNQQGFIFTNFYKPPFPIRIAGELWPTTEHYYQACKFTKDSPEWKAIQSLPDADAVYDYIYPNRSQGDYTPRQFHVTEDEWLVKRDDVMMTALRAKAKDVDEFRRALRESGDKILFEVSPKDSYWGTARNKITGEVGKNVLGAMLMQIRDELRTGAL